MPSADVTAKLVSEYTSSGISYATPNLMTGIAFRESQYTNPPGKRFSGQFSVATLYGQTLSMWPTESPGGISTGLMQVDVNMQNAWDWQANIKAGVALFTTDKWNFAIAVETKILRAHTGLSALTSTQLEDMALGEYGPGAFGYDAARAVYIASCLVG